jgi:hypothetical protein
MNNLFVPINYTALNNDIQVLGQGKTRMDYVSVRGNQFLSRRKTVAIINVFLNRYTDG